MRNEKNLPSAQPPIETQAPAISLPKKFAGGLASVLWSFRHMMDELGLGRGVRALLRVNQKNGFDCPGCAWPDPDGPREIVEFCENGVKAVAEEATRKRADREVFARWSVSQLSELSDYEIGKIGRLTEPLWLKEGATHYEPISWESAFERIAIALNSVSSPNEAVFYTSGRTSNEAAFLYQLFVRIYGTNNLPDCSNMCHESSGVALTEALGIGKGTVTLDDFKRADCIVVLGQNPGTNHPRMLSALQEAAENGCMIISINPLEEAGLKRFKHPRKFWTWPGRGTKLSHLHLPVRINGDVALLKGIQKEILEDEASALDGEFIRKYTEGFEAYSKDLRETAWERIVEASGISREEISRAARLLARSRRMICTWAMGLTQHKNAIANIQEVANLLMLGGHLGRKGAGICPVRGHSNVQGDRTMGIHEKPGASFLDSLAREFGFDPPREPGYDVVDSIRAMHSGKVRVFFAMGGNFLSATPDTEYTAQALRNCSLTVQVSTKLNRSHLITGKQALILPCLGRSDRDLQASGEQFVTTENSMGVIQMSRGRLTPASPLLKSEVAIVTELALATFRHQPGKLKVVSWEKLCADYSKVRDLISRVIPGFSDFNRRLERNPSFYLPNPVRDERMFATSTGKARFTVHPIPAHELKEDQYLLMTIRTHDQFNTTIYGLNDRYRGVHQGRRVLLMNLEDIRGAGLRDGMKVDIISHFQGETRKAPRFRIASYSIPRRCVASYFPETNVLVPIHSTAEKSNTPAYKSVIVSLQPSDQGE